MLLLATCAAASAEQIALCSTQIAAIAADPAWLGGDYSGTSAGPVTGLGIARKIAHISYRGSMELEARFGRSAQPGEDPATGAAIAAFPNVLLDAESRVDGHHKVRIDQGFEMGRPSRLNLEFTIKEASVTEASVGGSAVVVAEGMLHI